MTKPDGHVASPCLLSNALQAAQFSLQKMLSTFALNNIAKDQNICTYSPVITTVELCSYVPWCSVFPAAPSFLPSPGATHIESHALIISLLLYVVAVKKFQRDALQPGISNLPRQCAPTWPRCRDRFGHSLLDNFCARRMTTKRSSMEVPLT